MKGLDYAFDNPFFPQELLGERQLSLAMRVDDQIIPPGVVARIEDPSVLVEYKRGKEMGCADIVLCTTMPDGRAAVLLSKRKATESFGGMWWIYGGSVGAYANVLDFIAARGEKECGVPVSPKALIGFYRTCAADQPQSTSQPCFAAEVDYGIIESKMRTDPNHEQIRLLTLEDLYDLPEAERHWYPMHVARLALLALGNND